MTRTHHSNYFFGHEVSDYGKESGYVDYRTLAASFDSVMSNDIISKTSDIGYWEQIGGFIDHSDEIEELENRIEELEGFITFDSSDDEDKITLEEIHEINAKIEELREDEDNYPEISQWFIISDNGAEILTEYTNEIVYYNEELDMYVWGVTHWGTAWDYVLTDIKIELD